MLVICAALVFTGCSARWEKNPQSDAAAPGGESQARVASAPSYSFVRSRVLAPRCIVCHQSSSPQNAGVLLEDYASTKAKLAAIQSAVFVDKTMPKGAKLSSEEAAILMAWVRAGAPENPDGAAQPPTQPAQPPKNVPGEFRWPRVQALVFQKSCASCHQFDAPMAREQIDGIIQRVLVKKDMPPEQGQMSEEQISVLVQWIRYGMAD